MGKPFPIPATAPLKGLRSSSKRMESMSTSKSWNRMATSSHILTHVNPGFINPGWLPCGNDKHSHWKWPSIASIPMKHGDFPVRYLKVYQRGIVVVPPNSRLGVRESRLDTPPRRWINCTASTTTIARAIHLRLGLGNSWNILGEVMNRDGDQHMHRRSYKYIYIYI